MGQFCLRLQKCRTCLHSHPTEWVNATQTLPLLAHPWSVTNTLSASLQATAFMWCVGLWMSPVPVLMDYLCAGWFKGADTKSKSALIHFKFQGGFSGSHVWGSVGIAICVFLVWPASDSNKARNAGKESSNAGHCSHHQLHQFLLSIPFFSKVSFDFP